MIAVNVILVSGCDSIASNVMKRLIVCVVFTVSFVPSCTFAGWYVNSVLDGLSFVANWSDMKFAAPVSSSAVVPKYSVVSVVSVVEINGCMSLEKVGAIT